MFAHNKVRQMTSGKCHALSAAPKKKRAIHLRPLCAALCAFEVPSHMELEFADNDETESRSREVQLLQNVIEPDPEYQALFISDEANLLDISGLDSKEIEARIRFYFKGDLPAPLNIPVWQFIEMVKQKYPRWPEEWPPKH